MMAEVWEQQEGESDSAYAAFAIYRGTMAPRQLAIAYRLWKKDPKARTSGTWQKWALDFNWYERAGAYDKRLDAVRRDVTEKVVAEIQEQHVRQIEISALNTLKENAAIAHSRITDVMSWEI